MTRGDALTRREALGRIAAAAGGGPLLGHPLAPRHDQAWQPLVFDPHQAATVTALAETIIPTTDTPGAAAALVHEFIDFELSEATGTDRTAFLDGLARLDRTSRERYGADFASVEASAQIALLAEMSAGDEGTADRTFFENAKQRTVNGYYTSRIGLHEELQYRGNAFLQRFEGCTHPEHQRWEPEAGR